VQWYEVVEVRGRVDEAAERQEHIEAEVVKEVEDEREIKDATDLQ
jgi:flavin-binding protein dodecin